MAKKTVQKAERKIAPHCPYCDAEIFELNLPFCQACHVTIVRCTECLTVIPKNRKTCPSCGKPVKTK